MSQVDDFKAGLSFEPDQFQIDAFESFASGNNVIVSAPTGSGKTLVAEFSVFASLAAGRRVFYTTPIKALSNQKYGDLVDQYGSERVGLLTGDSSINGDADVVVMTTEVLRNMLYEGRDLTKLGCVVLDEVHFLQDKYRGAVWEEVIINLGEQVQLVALSATVSNAEELMSWFSEIRGVTDLVISTKRPVPLQVKYMVSTQGGGIDFIDVLKGSKPNRVGFGFDRTQRSRRQHKGNRSKQKRKRYFTPRIGEAILTLSSKNLLPAIYFKFSRQGCEDEAKSLVGSGIKLNCNPRGVEELAEFYCADLSEGDREALHYDRFLDHLRHGVGVHHAGLVPQFKQVVEHAFNKGYLDVVVATETLALGVNMPARSVVIEKLTKYNGQGHDLLTPSQFSQLSGRAGRRGLDTLGTAVVLWSPFVEFSQVASLTRSGDFRLDSSFRPNYNMATNLIRLHTESEAEALLAKSFAQHQTASELAKYDRRLSKLGRRKEKLLAAKRDPAEEKRLKRIERQLSRTAADAERQEQLIVEEFRRVRSVLQTFGLTEGWALTNLGEWLVQIYHESDLFICLALADGILDGLEVEELASVLSCFCYEERRRDIEQQAWFPTKAVRARVIELEKLAKEVNRVEKSQDLEETRAPDAGFIPYIHHWASGGDLADIAEETFSVGDFYRTVKKVVDLAKSLDPLVSDRAKLREMIDRLDRGVIRTARVGASDAD